MKRLIVSLFVLTAVSFATVTVDGYALLENQTTHDSIQIVFERIAPSSLLDTAYTATDGSYTIQLETGIYDVTYTKDGYFYQSLTDQSFYANTTISSLTLLEHTTLINVPSLFSTIQTAIDHAFEGDTILVQPDTYVENINYNGKNIVVGSLYLTTSDTSYISSTIIDGNQSGSVVTFNNDEDTTVVLSGFKVINGSAGNGGGIYCSGSSPSLENLIISGNSASNNGGGLWCNGGQPNITNSTIIENSSSRSGGGIFGFASDMNLLNVTIASNSSMGWVNYSGGGGLYLSSGGNNMLKNVLIINNSASRHGGGIYFKENGSSLTNVRIIQNSSISGSGIYCERGYPSLMNVTISGNSASQNGGGISIDPYSNGSNATVPSLANTIVSDNTGNYGIYIDLGWWDYSEDVIPTITYSDFYNNENGNCNICGEWVGLNVTTNANGDSVDAYMNIQLDPLFVDTTNGDYNLQQGSPCIDAGDPTSTYDADGSIADMGALPSAYGTPVPIVINVPTDYSTIQAGLTAAGTNDTVLVQPGTYTENIIWPETNGIKLISAGDSSNTIIDGGGTSSVIYMNPQTATIDTTTLIQGFKITNGGNVSNGGGLFISNASPSISHLLVIDNEANDNCGGIYFPTTPTPGQSVIRNITIMNNTAYNDGGGLCCGNSIEILKNAVIKGNIATNGHGGGIIIGGAINLVNVIIDNNTSLSVGGGIYMVGDNANLTSVKISNNITNSPSSGGGGIYIEGSAPTFVDVTINNNSSTHNGGGVYIWHTSNGTIEMDNIYVHDNFAEIYGGGLYIGTSSNVNLTNSKILKNSAGSANRGGGGIFIRNSDYTNIENTIIAENNAILGGGLYYWDRTVTLSTVTIINNQATYNGGGIYVEGSFFENSIQNSLIINNSSNNGRDGIYIDEGDPIITGNNIIGNGIGLHNNDNSNITDATNNFWGDSSGPYHPNQNPTGQGDSTNVFVNVTPWLTTPNTDAPPIPAQNTTVTGTGNDFISLKWDTSPLGDLAGYKLYYDSDSSGYPYANSVDIGTDTSYILSSLTLGTTYYLAVTTYDTDGNESWYSNEVTGTTRVMQAQSLDIGGDEDLQHMVSHTPSITFGYYDSMDETQTNYQIQVSTDSTFSSANMWDAGSVSSDTTSVTYAGTALVDGSTYYLRVRVASGDFWSDWSTLTFRMNTEPTTPVLVSPINNQVSGTPVGLKVLNATDAEGDAITYSFNVYSDGTLTTKLDSVTAVAEGTDTTSWQITGSLPDNGQYFWTVSTNDGYEQSAVSDAGSFLLNTDNNAPEAFTLSMPLVDTEIQNLSPVFSWHSANDPDPIDTVHYTLMLDTPDPGVEVFDVGTDTSFQVTNALMDNTEYFWQVMAEDIIGFQTINEGGYQTFYTNVSNDPPSVSTLVAPLNGSIQTDLTPNFYWTEAVDPDPLDHVSYTMRWWGTGDMGIQSIDTDSNGVTPETILMDNSVWEWMVTANDMHNSQSTSDTSYFYSDAFPEPPLNFATVAPENNVEGLGTEVEFVWEETDDPDPVEEISYRVVYATNWEDSSTYVYSETIEDTTMVITLADNSQYYWLVEALDSDGFIVGSNENTPNVIIVGTLAIDGDLIPVEFALRQNYPNPFNPVTTLRYDLPEQTHVNITVYDMLGRKVRTILNQQQDPGYKSLIWDATNDYGKPVSAGIYLYQIQAGQYIQTKKMVLLK